ncbi:putative sarcosine oxidase beta subunit [Azorhizobium caulinodans ORS 571]|uniref:Putative sarcosine oxidase beta subunit n=1 Tax=Azorhizobium caulinodans (strain ATCC 43989 / DSM 5975 / JCM 20966 / LMG 6465 / NBRC 14845 / NCIMB 13405 / ORS 571) TaxID=438753 RepID=A8I0B8_AZOC5|nr:FAD-dependent oxidoreductase [Azorhizobium caulinodans]BAF87236.1 putative sarcosine oxidase beta subunit [Azorhizobium caulinodans ORS 571]
MARPDVLIIGGGLHGCSTALHLARRGVKALVIEKDHAGRHASGVNAGGVRRLGRAFAEVPLSVASMELWHSIRDLVDDDCGFESHGQVKVAEDEGDLALLAERVARLNALGFTHEELIAQDELRALLPAVSPHCVGGIVSRADGAALPFRTVLAFRNAAIRLGATFLEGRPAGLPERRGGLWRVQVGGKTHEAPVLVNAAGAWADRIAAALGEPVPLEVIAPMLMITLRMPPFVKPVVGATRRPLSFKQYANGTVLIGGGHRGIADRDTNRTSLDFGKLAFNARTAAEIFPIMAEAQINRAWAGIEARMPDDIPVIGPSLQAEAAYHAFGFSAHGFQLGPIVGSILAELVTTGASNLPIAPFSIGRFAAPVAQAG